MTDNQPTDAPPEPAPPAPPPAEAAAPPASPVEVAQPDPAERIAALEAQQRETYDKYVRAVADLDNVRKRTRKETEEARADAQGRVLREMLPVVDNLERAIAHAGTGDAASIVEGVKLVLRQFTQAFERCGVTAIEAKGKPFDPNLHEAVSQVETAEHPPGTVVEVLQTGYRIGERLLRPALTVVSRAPAGAAEPEA